MRRNNKKGRWISLPERFIWVIGESDIRFKVIGDELHVLQADLERTLAKARAEGKFREEQETDEEMQNLLASDISNADNESCQEVCSCSGKNVLRNNLEVFPMYRLVPGCYTSIITGLELVRGYDLHEGFFINYILEDSSGNLYDFKEFFLSDASNERYKVLTEYLGKAGNTVGVYVDLVGVCEELTLARVSGSHVLRVSKRKFIDNLDFIGQNVG